ncbi:DUF2304 domain-containing protein [Paenibacillus sp. S-38]|uniref:DUF2304 domain-containing protein n=1 Tax=Paenibacillus sp. S-38 TaxID=3416710 RepID=UPI003CE80588
MTINTLSITVSLLFLIVVLELMRRHRLKEQYALLWILFSLLLIIASVNVSVIEWLSALLNVKYAPALLFLFGLLVCFALILHLTVTITRMSKQLLRVTQELTILKGKQESS